MRWKNDGGVLSVRLVRRRALYLKPPIIWDANDKMSCGVCIADSWEAAKSIANDWDGLLIVCRPAPMSIVHRASSYSLLCLAEPHSIREVFNFVQRVFMDFEAWDKRLRDILMQPDAQKLLEACLPMIKADLGLMDDKLVQLAFAGFETAVSRTPDSLLRLQKNLPFMYKVLNDTKDMREPFDAPPVAETADRSTIGLNIMNGKTKIACLYAQSRRKLRPQDYELLRHISVYLRYILTHMPLGEKSELSRVKDIFRQMLHSQHINHDELKNTWLMIGFGAADRFRCLSIETPLGLESTFKRYIGDRITAIIPATVSILYDEHIAVLINHTIAETTLPSYLDEARQLMESARLQVGVSGLCDKVYEIRYYYRSAQAALTMGKVAGDRDFLIPFEKYCSEYSLFHCKGNLKPHMLYPAGLRRLIEHDANAGVSYVETLDVYLREGRNIARAAKRLCIHRSSLQARLQHVFALLQDDLEDPYLCNHLNLCIRLYYRNRRDDET
ncbi:MAG: helix-turn-helix domain-containing protein [Clostridiales Family XIII bacterium]|jgi:hypothetical protein|nr:helix-turn-helix domain-containing protein [Clostridiales Family XIII bacterium]